MQRFAVSVCSPCRQSFFRPVHPGNLFNECQRVSRRFRSGQASGKFEKRPKAGFGGAWVNGGYTVNQTKPNHVRKNFKQTREGDFVRLTEAELPSFLAVRTADWSKMPLMMRRLESFGIPREDIPILLKAFVTDVEGGLLTRPEIYDQYSLERFAGSYSTGKIYGRLDEVFTNIFYAWASDPAHQSSLKAIVPPSTLHGIVQLHQAADLSYPADEYIEARSIRRKFIMHVGPTNSGKTHMALRALAAAKLGVYAGPLRLLAHEVWERLNKGQIVPLGMDPETDTEADTNTNFDVVSDGDTALPTVRKQSSTRYARECNLLTGEESKVVSDYATLLSCTIEMLMTDRLFDVAVVDEIQMIADADRGGGWTRAVLGLYAKEIHLCGEETAVPIIEAILEETGDELVVNRYERLTPLVVQEQSLEGNIDRVQKGDCIVAFSRSRIFALKRQVEELTGMRCAVAYGRLPPEIRSEQAALFNDPESGYDVMIGSDAIGMGLNLKIKRVVFEALHKYNGAHDIRLSTSQIKQIAGRAGRYGLGEPGGFTTTLYPDELPILRKALTTAAEPLDRAFVHGRDSSAEEIARCLPFNSPSLSTLQVLQYVSRLDWPYRFEIGRAASEMCEFVDTRAGSLTLEDKTLLMVGPVPWRDQMVVEVVAQFYVQYRTQMRVNLIECLRGTLLGHLEDVEKEMKRGPPRSSQQTLNGLESLHKALVLYMWMHMRSPVAWCDHVEVSDLKARTERALDWSLQGISWRRKQRDLPDIVALRRKKKEERIAFVDSEFIRKRAETRRNSKRIGGASRTGY